VSVVDLTKDGFNPVMSRNEWEQYIATEDVVPQSLEPYVDQLQAAQIVVFVYPTWWGGLPALLKGWIERTMLPGVAFRLNKKKKVRPALTQVRHIVVISTFGSPWAYVKFINDNGRRILVRAMRLATSWRTRTHCFGLYAMDKASQEDREKFIRSVENKLAKI
jgi:putative NADPH-quinone reductase